MKKKSLNKWLIFTTILMYLLVVSYGVIQSVNESSHKSDEYIRDIIIRDTVVFDDQHIVKLYGGPITLEAGTAGKIHDRIDSHAEKHGYKHIRASFPLGEGKEIDVILGYEMESGKDTEVIVETSDASVSFGDGKNDWENTNTIEIVTPVININKISDSQTIISEFNQMHERYYGVVKQTIIKDSVIAAICAFVVVAVVWLIKILIRKENAGKALVVVTICIDAVMALAVVLELYFTNQH